MRVVACFACNSEWVGEWQSVDPTESGRQRFARTAAQQRLVSATMAPPLGSAQEAEAAAALQEMLVGTASNEALARHIRPLPHAVRNKAFGSLATVRALTRRFQQARGLPAGQPSARFLGRHPARIPLDVGTCRDKGRALQACATFCAGFSGRVKHGPRPRLRCAPTAAPVRSSRAAGG